MEESILNFVPIKIIKFKFISKMTILKLLDD